ncbi:hypothetical protein J3F83DRAFT_690985 [Trichoderma novae-zelandiae]
MSVILQSSGSMPMMGVCGLGIVAVLLLLAAGDAGEASLYMLYSNRWDSEMAFHNETLRGSGVGRDENVTEDFRALDWVHFVVDQVLLYMVPTESTKCFCKCHMRAN